MTPREAKELLLLYRPGRGDEADPQVAEALELARQDPELQRWLEANSKFHDSLTKQFRSLPVPQELKADILLGPKVVRGPAHWWSRTAPIAAAACIALAAIIATIWVSSNRGSDYNQFRSRIVGSVLREYRMDIVTNDMQVVRAYLSAKGAPADYQVPDGLAALPLTGAGVVPWEKQSVSMVCFDRGAGNMVFMFVSQRKTVKDPPPAPQFAMVKGLSTLSWTAGEKIYLVAAAADENSLRSYLP